MSGSAVRLSVLLAVLGAGWGLTQPLAKIAVGGGHQPFGIVFWQLALGALILGTVMLWRREPLPRGHRHVRLYVVIALIGTVLPNSASFLAAIHLPAGLISILLSLVPIFAFPIALALGTEGFSPIRLFGLGLGLAGVVLIVGPEASLPDPAMLAFVPIALIAPLFYALEGNVVAKWGTFGATPVAVLFGASVAGAVVALPLALTSGQFVDPRAPWGLPEGAIVLSATVHAFVYCGYVWLVGRAGATFAAQVSYFVTGFGVLWAMALLGERYTIWVWGALALMTFGLFLVQPHPGKAFGDLSGSRRGEREPC